MSEPAETCAEAVVDALHLIYREGLDSDAFMLFREEYGNESYIQGKDETEFNWWATAPHRTSVSSDRSNPMPGPHAPVT